MSCEVKYIKENYSQHPDYQRLTDTYHAGMKELVSSKLFEEKNDKLKWAKEGTSSRIKQNKLAQSVENEFNVLVQDNKGNVVVNISPLINQNIQFQKAQNIEGEYNETVSPFEKMTYEEQQAFELSIRDLSARIADRIGMTYQIENNKSEKYKGKIKNNVAYINLAYATLDTPIHEILGHPIIRAIKNNSTQIIETKTNGGKIVIINDLNGKELRRKFFKDKTNQKEINSWKLWKVGNKNELYQNLLKELETGRGKEVLDRIKRDYQYKTRPTDWKIKKVKDGFIIYDSIGISEEESNWGISFTKIINKKIDGSINYFNTEEEANKFIGFTPYTLEEQQEEALVELLGMMTAEKLDNVKDGKLISLLKRLLKEMKQFVRSLLNQKEVEIDKLPDNMTINDLADLLAYSNNKLILPGYEVEYTTPDNNKFKTYKEASNHISELAKSVEDVDLSDKILDLNTSNSFTLFDKYGSAVVIRNSFEEAEKYAKETNLPDGYEIQNNNKNLLNQFIEKNKPYEQSKEIIEEWKKVNNIVYNPEEIYSRGQEFTSVVGAYSSFDVNLMMQNLLQHIEDNEKAGGQFAISAYTKPIDKKINHLEGGSKIKFKLYPKSEDILWASNIDVYSGSVWDASAKVNKDKKSELLGVSYTKYPSLDNINSVQPNLAAIVDDLQHYHNELGIVLTGSNFRLEYDEYIPYSTKKIINSINSILDQKYGKLVKPEIKKAERKQVGYSLILDFNDGEISIIKEFKNKEDADKALLEERKKQTLEDINSGYEIKVLPKIEQGIQPTQTNETLKESIDNVKNKYSTNLGEKYLDTLEVRYYTDYYDDMSLEGFVIANYGNSPILNELLSKEPIFNTEEDANNRIKELIKQAEEIYNDRKNNQKEYTSQALINTKIAVLKEIAKSYPLSLIRSEVRKSNTSSSQELSDQFDFQKIQEENELGLAPLEIKKCK